MNCQKTESDLQPMKKLIMIGYRPGRKSQMTKRTEIDHGYPVIIFGSLKDHFKIYKNTNPKISDISK